MPGDERYTLTTDLQVLKHLGFGLYSSVPAVISEVVANAYDADASHVGIVINEAKRTITVTDNGHGMTEDDINRKYLSVGYNRRLADAPRTPKYGRLPMGRKGIGKLALFAIASVVEVRTARMTERGRQRAGCVLNGEDIEEAIQRGGDYHPVPIDPPDGDVPEGTRITLRDVKLGMTTEQYLRRRLARRFSIIGDEYHFAVDINGTPVTIADRDYFSKIEFLWRIGDEGERYEASCTNCSRSEPVDGTIDERSEYRVTGWVGTVRHQEDLSEGDNTIVIQARGKLIHEDLLKDLKEAGVYAKYLIGELRADFLDADSEEDMATSDRQSLKESDTRFQVLKKYVQGTVLKEIQRRWRRWRRENAVQEVTHEHPRLRVWLDSLGPNNRRLAEDLLGRINEFPVDDPEDKRELLRHGIVAFQTLAVKDNLALLAGLESEADLDQLLSLAGEIDDLEEAYYYQILKGRLAVLGKFEELVDADAKERVLQVHLFKHLWLLDPSWERAACDERMEQRVTKAFAVVIAGLTDDEKRARIDICYKTAAGKHIIVELKKYSARTHVDVLTSQVRKYRGALEKCLTAVDPTGRPNIEVVCVLGSRPLPEEDDQRNRGQLRIHDARYITYDELIEQTRHSYRDYLDTMKRVREVEELVNSLSPTSA